VLFFLQVECYHLSRIAFSLPGLSIRTSIFVLQIITSFDSHKSRFATCLLSLWASFNAAFALT
jgi:hypothetical protein